MLSKMYICYMTVHWFTWMFSVTQITQTNVYIGRYKSVKTVNKVYTKKWNGAQGDTQYYETKIYILWCKI